VTKQQRSNEAMACSDETTKQQGNMQGNNKVT